MQFITLDNRIAVENFQIGYFYTITFNNHNYIITTCTGKGDNFVSFLCSEPELVFDLTMQTADSIATIELYGGGSGTTDYNNLSNKPTINNVILVGNKTTSDLLINDVPAVTSADDNKILLSSYSGGVGSYSWETYSPVSSYDDLSDKPTINSVTLTGNKTCSDLGIQPEINSENLLLSDNVNDTNQTNKFATAAQLEQITTNENNISSLENIVQGVEYPYTDNRYIALGDVGTTISITPIDSPDWAYTIIDNVTVGMVYAITGTGGISPRLWAFVDVDLKVLSVAVTQEEATDKLIKAPSGAKYLICNGNIAETHELRTASLLERLNASSF